MMLHDVIRTDPTHFCAYLTLPEGDRPGDAENNAMARALGEDTEDLHVTSWQTITEPNEWQDDYEYDLWQDALQEQTVLWRLRGLIGDVPV